MCAALFEAKARKGTCNRPRLYNPLSDSSNAGLTFEAIGKAIERDEVWIAAAFYGQVICTSITCRKVFTDRFISVRRN